MSSQRSANAVGSKTARACDSCLRRRARWYCAADDAFLCQACDSSVHSANPLARRHDRVRLKTSSSASSLFSPPSDLNSALPAWHQGFKRKARTPRHAKASASMLIHKPAPLVPDLENINANNNIEGEEVDDDEEEEEEKEQLLYRVPIFDPVLSEFCSPPALDDTNPSTVEEVKPAVNLQLLPAENQNHGFAGFNPSEMELEEFAADVENLLGQGMDVDDSFCIDGLGLLEAREDIDRNQVKMELMDTINNNNNSNANLIVDAETEFSRESLDFNFDCCRSPAIGEEADVEQKLEDCYGPIRNYKVGLRLDYEAVIAAWSTSSCRDCSPWTDGERPQFNLDDCWPDFTGMWGVGEVQRGGYGEGGLGGGQMGNGDRGREARVSRYREKRRTRLFSKKIRYEVRKLNAEKRPRMKGRFVKRSSFPPAAAAVVAAGPAAAAFPYV